MRDIRLKKVVDIIEKYDLDGCIIRGMDNIFYITGFRGSEGTLVVTKGDVFLLTDFRYITHAREVTRNIKIVEVSAKNDGLSEIFTQYGLTKIGFDSAHTPYQLYKKWKENLKDTQFIPMEGEIEEIRKIKEPSEIDAIRRSINIATEAFNRVFETIKPGKTEKEIACELDYTMRRIGADGPSFDVIVASGPRSALPHAVPSPKRIEEGETLIIDFGARVDGYCSDETCTLAIGEVGEKLKEIFYIANGARELAIERARAGMPIKELDTIVRDFIDRAGYGDFFRHGVGHGVGISVHESPSINSLSDGLLEENMVITIEPGIYLPNLGGVRVEDMVLITETGAKVLTYLRKELVNVCV
ncbi:MAG: aminopeptidase P family protein [Syntrophorhabdaceae bacterium]|nr:aminopeptidase P family protein [Syntrophorhabdaceae bacterium]